MFAAFVSRKADMSKCVMQQQPPQQSPHSRASDGRLSHHHHHHHHGKEKRHSLTNMPVLHHTVRYLFFLYFGLSVKNSMILICLSGLVLCIYHCLFDNLKLFEQIYNAAMFNDIRRK